MVCARHRPVARLQCHGPARHRRPPLGPSALRTGLPAEDTKIFGVGARSESREVSQTPVRLLSDRGVDSGDAQAIPLYFNKIGRARPIHVHCKSRGTAETKDFYRLPVTTPSGLVLTPGASTGCWIILRVSPLAGYASCLWVPSLCFLAGIDTKKSRGHLMTLILPDSKTVVKGNGHIGFD
jgi:hypothetical protein